MTVTIEASGGETKSVQGSEDEGETIVDKVEVKFIKRSKSYDIYFQIGLVPAQDSHFALIFWYVAKLISTFRN